MPINEETLEVICKHSNLRPGKPELEKSLISLLRSYSPETLATLELHLDQYDKAAATNEQAGWPYIDELVQALNNRNATIRSDR